MLECFIALCVLGLLALLLRTWVLIEWPRRDAFWRSHHDHLIPPNPRSPRKGR